MPKILPNGQVTFEADARDAAAAALVDAGHDPAGVAVVTGTEHPADGTVSPEVGNDGPGEAEPVAEAPEVVPVPDAAPAPEPGPVVVVEAGAAAGSGAASAPGDAPAVHLPPRPPRRPGGGGNG